MTAKVRIQVEYGEVDVWRKVIIHNLPELTEADQDVILQHAFDSINLSLRGGQLPSLTVTKKKPLSWAACILWSASMWLMASVFIILAAVEARR